jgi:hypothetical protein
MTGDAWTVVGSLTYSSVSSGVIEGVSYNGTTTGTGSYSLNVVIGGPRVRFTIDLLSQFTYVDPDGTVRNNTFTGQNGVDFSEQNPATLINGIYVINDATAGWLLNFATLEQLLRPFFLRTTIYPTDGDGTASGSVTVECDRFTFNLTRTTTDGTETWTGTERWIPANTKGCGPRCGAVDAAPVSLSALAELFA